MSDESSVSPCARARPNATRSSAGKTVQSLLRRCCRPATRPLRGMLYLLDTHPAVERRFSEALTAMLGERVPTGEVLPHLPYRRMVVEEALRLYPPAWRFLGNAVTAGMLEG